MRRLVKRPTIARNTSGFTRGEILAALKVCGSRPPGGLLLDLTKSRKQLRGWCHHYRRGWVSWTHNGTEYVADCYIRLRVADAPSISYALRTGRGQRTVLEVTRWQALAMLLAHEIQHWRQLSGQARCSQLDADKAAIRVARKLKII